MLRGGIWEYQPFDRRIFGVVKTRNNKDHEIAEALQKSIFDIHMSMSKKMIVFIIIVLSKLDQYII